MDIQFKSLPASEIEFTIRITPGEYQPFLERAATHIAKEHKIEGFRPGSAPYNIIKQKFGEAEIINHALSDIITHTLSDALKQKELYTLGQPEINITKIAPGNDLVYTAKLTLIPDVKLPDLNSISLTKKEITIEDKELNHTLDHLARSRAAETLIDSPAENKNLVKMDYSISINNVPQEDGQQKDFAAYLGESHMVPGFEEQIIGLKSGDTKKFDIKFPADYFKKNFAGKTCTFDVKINGVYKLDIPKLDDDFAKSLGQFKTLAELKQQIKQNIQQEKEIKQTRELEQDMLKKIIDKTEFDKLPDKIIDSEIENIIHELEHDLSSKGLKMETWLSNMQKTLEQFKKDLRPQAELRAKSALIIRAVTQQEKIKVDNKELDNQINQLFQMYKDSKETLNQLKSAQYRNYLANTLTGQKAMDWLKKKIIKE